MMKKLRIIRTDDDGRTKIAKLMSEKKKDEILQVIYKGEDDRDDTPTDSSNKE